MTRGKGFDEYQLAVDCENSNYYTQTTNLIQKTFTIFQKYLVSSGLAVCGKTACAAIARALIGRPSTLLVARGVYELIS